LVDLSHLSQATLRFSLFIAIVNLTDINNSDKGKITTQCPVHSTPTLTMETFSTFDLNPDLTQPMLQRERNRAVIRQAKQATDAVLLLEGKSSAYEHFQEYPSPLSFVSGPSGAPSPFDTADNSMYSNMTTSSSGSDSEDEKVGQWFDMAGQPLALQKLPQEPSLSLAAIQAATSLNNGADTSLNLFSLVSPAQFGRVPLDRPEFVVSPTTMALGGKPEPTVASSANASIINATAHGAQVATLQAAAPQSTTPSPAPNQQTAQRGEVRVTRAAAKQQAAAKASHSAQATEQPPQSSSLNVSAGKPSHSGYVPRSVRLAEQQAALTAAASKVKSKNGSASLSTRSTYRIGAPLSPSQQPAPVAASSASVSSSGIGTPRTRSSLASGASSPSQAMSEIDGESVADAGTPDSKRRRLARKAELARLSRMYKKNRMAELEEEVANLRQMLEATRAEQRAALGVPQVKVDQIQEMLQQVVNAVVPALALISTHTRIPVSIPHVDVPTVFARPTNTDQRMGNSSSMKEESGRSQCNK